MYRISGLEPHWDHTGGKMADACVHPVSLSAVKEFSLGFILGRLNISLSGRDLADSP
jgi:hypothetical protein